MKITVITAVFNRAGRVGQAIDSVLAQTHQDIELLVQDGGSTDGTLNIVRQIEDPRLSVVSAPDCGIYDALNRGIARASGDVVGLMQFGRFLCRIRCPVEGRADVRGPPGRRRLRRSDLRLRP